ncbi:hypothetical protein HDU86_006752 [Geranomyces michiganensis]|nr:hypothetical protein HDU86_006752 [Geranomyces michiganensis]
MHADERATAASRAVPPLADGSLSYANLRRSARLLSSDFTFTNCCEHEAAWKVIWSYMEMQESSLRYFGLQCASLASRSMSRTLNSASRKKIVAVLMRIVTGDEVWSNRCVAARILGELAEMPANPGDPPKWKKHALNAVLGQLLEVFPAALGEQLKADPTALDSSHYINPQRFRTRVHMLHASSCFLGCPEALTPSVMGYLDRLLATLLSSKAHHLLQAAAMHAIHAHLPVTNRNRLRVERFFREPMVKLSDLARELDSVQTTGSSAPAEPFPADAKTMHPLVRKQMDSFWSVWFPQPDDAHLKEIACTSDQVSRLNGVGYAARRWAWLSMDNYRRSGKPFLDAGKRGQDKTAPEPYNPLAHDVALLQLRLFDSVAPALEPAKASSTYPRKESEEVAEESASETVDASTLSFNMNPPILLFNRYPFQKDVFLQNKSMTTDVSFRLHAGPSQFFNVTPAFGVLNRGESVTVTVSFTSCPYATRKSPEISGFLRVRSSAGLPFERINLRGYNMPAVKITPMQLDFGLCPIGDTRTMVFIATNLLPVDCPIVMLVVPSATSTMFHIYPTQTILNPKEKKTFQIRFEPTADGEIRDHLLVVAFGGEVSKIKLSGISGQALRVLDSKLDFGPTDIYYNAVVKRVSVKNRDKTPMPVSFVSSTQELIVNDGSPVILQPFEERKVNVAFLSAFTGARQESLVFHAPHTTPMPIDVLAFSGPTTWFPVCEHAVLPTALVGSVVSTQMPLVNLSSGTVQCVITVPIGTPFTVQIAEPETANRKAPTLQVDVRPFEGPDSVGVSVTIGPRLTAVVRLEFVSSTWGTFKAPLTVQMLKPRKWPVAVVQLGAIAVSELYLARERPLELIRKFVVNPVSEPATGAPPKKAVDPAAATEPIKTSEIFELDPPVQVIFGQHLSGRFEDICESVTLTNLTSVTQKYHIAISEHFYTDVPLSGELEGMATLDILVRLDESFMEGFKDPEAKHRVLLGALTVFDNDERKLGMVSSGLHGIFGDLLSYEARDGVTSVRYPPLKVMEKHTRRFFIRNRSPFDVVWEGRMSSIGQTGVGLQADGLPMIVPTGASASEWCPFNLSIPRISLKPFEFYTLEVAFQATSSGEYRAKLFMEYLDPVMHFVNSEHMRGKAKRMMRQFIFSCSVGNEDTTSMPEVLIHGDVEIGDSVKRSLTVINNQPLSTRISVKVPAPFRVSEMDHPLKSSSKLDLPTMFEPTQSRTYSALVVMSFSGKTRTVPLIGTGGRSGLLSNLATPLRLTSPTEPLAAEVLPSEESLIDFGYVELGRPKDNLFTITNSGSFDYTVKSIILSDEQYVAWKFIDDVAGENDGPPRLGLVDFGNVRMDAPELDWDEIDHKAAEQAGGMAGFGRQSIVSSVNTAPRRRRYKSISQSVSGPGTISKAFPFRLPPGQQVNVSLSFSGFEKGEHDASIRVDLERSNGEPEAYVFWIRGNLQPALQLWEKRIEYGVRAVHIKHKSEIKFTNTGSVALSWTLSQDNVRYTAMEKFDPMPLPKDEKAIPPPFSFFPLSGKLFPGCTQSVAVAFTPSLAQYEVNSYCTLRTEEFAETQIVVHGTGASSRITVDVDQLDFGIIRVGTKKSFRLSVRNRGILPLKYFVECSNTQFSADPEQGLLEGAGAVDIVVKFVPKAVGQLNETLRILPHPQAGYSVDPIVLALKGMGSYPELVVLTKMVDFGTALFMTRNVQPVTVQNKGAAEAHIAFSCHHPGISLDDKESYEVTIGPHTTKDIHIVYVPQVVETLKTKAFLRSSDSRGDHFILALTGTVGVPKLAFDPPDILEQLDFGVCAVNGIYKKTFIMANEGNISLPYELSLENRLTTVHNSEGKAAVKPVASKPGIINVHPTSGALAVGTKVEITITFVPDALAEYECQMNLNYEFRSSSARITGVGGRAVLRIDSPLSLLDFGICRLHRIFRKPLTISNAGNLGVNYHLRPEPPNGDWGVYTRGQAGASWDQPVAAPTEGESVPPEPWVGQLASKGFRLLNPDGYCKPHGKTDLIIEFSPSTELLVETRLRVYFGDQFEDIEICGRAASPRLTLYGQSNELLGGSSEIRTLDLGVHPINSEHSHTLQLKNDGPFGVDYLVQPFSMPEFDVKPLRGFIMPGGSIPLRVYFRPNSESKFQATMKILWEKEPLCLQMDASGGIGKLEIVYSDEKDMAINGLDFGMVPFNSSSERHFYLYNVGMVEISMEAAVDNDEYVIATIGEPIPHQQNTLAPAVPPKPPSPSKRTIWNWYPTLRATIPPGTGIELIARFVARSPTISAGNIQIRSEGGSFIVPMRGKGGTIQITHRGDLTMGDIATNYVYKRKLVIVNAGSIPATLTAEWLVVGHSAEPSSAFIQLNDNFSSLDPRSGWARQQLCAEMGVTEVTLTAKLRWRLIGIQTRKVDMLEEVGGTGDPLSKLWGSTLGKLRSLLKDQKPTQESGLGPPQVPNSASSSSSNVAGRAPMVSSPSQMFQPKKGLPAQYSAHFKRRQMFFHLIRNTQLTSQSLSDVKPHLRVDPPVCLLPSYGEVTLNVDIDLATEDTFLATLVIKPNVPNTPPHEISLTATPKTVNIVCDDTRILNFHRQPLGESEFIMRTFTNVGHKDINYHFINPNASLKVVPSRGSLKVGQTTTVRFTFEPTDEAIQSGDVVFEPDISQPIRLKMYGGGGYTKVSLARYRRFDFGHCMIGKDTVSFLPVNNEGNAVLHLNRFELHETDTFFKGMDWPTSRVSLFPGQTFNLPIVFSPHEESPAPGRLIVGTAAESWEIELIGLGREAVLIVSKVALEFSECLIGNSYEQKLGLKNVGDVNYPVTFKLEREFPDIEFLPASLVIHPFSESEVTIAYTPTRETKSTVVLTVSSPYSTHKVPLLLHAGTAFLEFDSEVLDFGMFERTTAPSVRLSVTNVGTVRTSYSVRDTVRPSMFTIGHSKGILQPGRTVSVAITHVKHEVAQFEERLVVRTDLIDKLYHITVKGQCEEALLRAEEFNVCNMGVCPVLENTTKPISLTNYGRFPLEFNVKSSYPLKVAPSSGTIAGGEESTFSVTWNPSGGYELRTHIAMVTNIGTFNIQVRGKAAFPELVIKNMYLDFGVCAVGHMYKEIFTLTNKGKVPVHFSIPPSREASYTVGTTAGTLDMKESMDIEAFFKPASTGKFAHTFLVECKGINYKEVVVVGIGGAMRLEFSPPALDLGRCPCDLRVFHSITLLNKGDVILFIDFKMAEETTDCQITMPDPLVLRPGRSTRCFFGVTIAKIGQFQAKILVCTKERTHSVSLTGSGIKIVLDPRSKSILDKEQLASVNAPGPFGQEIRFGGVDDWIRKFSRKYKLDMMVSEWLVSLYMASRGTAQLSELGPVFGRAGSAGLFEEVKPTTPIDTAASDTPLQKETQRGTGEVGEWQDRRQSLTNAPVFPADDETSSARPVAVSIPKNAVHIPGPPPPPAIPPEGGLRETITKETHLHGGGGGGGGGGDDGATAGSSPAPMTESGGADDEAWIAAAAAAAPAPVVPAINVALEKRMTLLRAVEEIRTAALVPEVGTVDALVDTFIGFKLGEVDPPQADIDPIVEHVLRYPSVEILQYDITPILCDEEPDPEINLDFLLARPPPFKNDVDKPAEAREEQRGGQGVYKTWVPMDRRARNAKTVDSFRR